MQLNVELQSYGEMTSFMDAPNLMFPVLWLEQVSNQLKQIIHEISQRTYSNSNYTHYNILDGTFDRKDNKSYTKTRNGSPSCKHYRWNLHSLQYHEYHWGCFMGRNKFQLVWKDFWD